MDVNVDNFLKKSKLWKEEIAKLRTILLKMGLEESVKWSKPCYAYRENNIAIIQPFKNYLALMYFKGKLLKDSKEVLVSNGPNSQSACRFEFKSMDEIKKMSSLIKTYTQEAIDLEKSGAKIEFKRKPEPMPVELKAMLAKNASLKKSFEALTPGRQRSYILHVSSAKQEATRISRIQKCIPNILKGKGFNE